MEIAAYIAAVHAEGERLAAAAEHAGLDAPVPACPGWNVCDLLRHAGYVHRWATGYVTEQHLTWVDRSTEAEILQARPADDQMLPGWFRDGYQRLASALERAEPDMKCWTFGDAPSPLAFWARRQAHETAIHRVDAQQAAGIPDVNLDPFTPGLAADGVDELLMGFARRSSQHGLRSDPPGWLAVHVAGRDWIVRMGPDSAEVTRGVPPAGHPPAGRGCEVTGPPDTVYRLLWNRGRGEGLELRGDPTVLEIWREQMRVRWT